MIEEIISHLSRFLKNDKAYGDTFYNKFSTFQNIGDNTFIKFVTAITMPLALLLGKSWHGLYRAVIVQRGANWKVLLKT